MDNMPESDASFNGGTNGSVDGFSQADLKRGYAKSQPLPDDDELDLYRFGPDYFTPVTDGWVER